MGQHAVDAHRCQQQGDDPERERQQHRCPPRVERLPDALGHREDIVRLQLGIECRERAPDRVGHVGGIAAAPDGEADAALNVLHVREIVRAGPGLLSLDESFELHRPDNADHLQPDCAGARLHDVLELLRQVHAAADRIGIRPELAGEPLVHDDDARRGRPVALSEQPASLQRNAQRFQIPGSHVQHAGRDDRLPRSHHISLGNDHAAAAVPAEREEAADAGRLHARQRADALERAAHIRSQRGIIRIPGGQRAHAPGHHVLRLEARVDAQELPEAREQQSGADQQHECQRHLRDDEPAADVAGTPAGGSGPAILPQDVAQVPSGHLHRGHRADNDSERQRQNGGERHDRAVHPDLVGARHVGQAQRRQRVEAPEPQREAEASPDDRQQHRLGDELTGDARAIRPERVARGELLQTPARAHEGKIRDVDRRNQQDEQHAAPQQLERRAHVAHHVGFERRELRVIARVDERLLQRTGPLEDHAVQGVDACLRLRQRGAGREPADLLVVLAVAGFFGTLLVGEREGHPDSQIGIEEGEIRRQHADHFVELVVETEIAADDAVDAAGLALGERVAEDGDLVTPQLALVLREQPAAHGGRPQDAEERRRHLHRGHTLGARAFADSKPAELIERLRLEHGRQRQAVEVVRHRRPRAFDAGAREGVVHGHEPAGLGVWQRPKQDRSDDREDGGVGADAQRQRQEGGEGEGAVLPEEPEREDGDPAAVCPFIASALDGVCPRMRSRHRVRPSPGWGLTPSRAVGWERIVFRRKFSRTNRERGHCMDLRRKCDPDFGGVRPRAGAVRLPVSVLRRRAAAGSCSLPCHPDRREDFLLPRRRPAR